MAADPPIACTLPAAEMPDRLAAMRAIGRGALTSAVTTESDAILRFRRDVDTLGRLQAIVAAESQCCAFLHFDLSETPNGIVLTVRAPKGGEAVMQGIVAAFRGEGTPTA